MCVQRMEWVGVNAEASGHRGLGVSTAAKCMKRWDEDRVPWTERGGVGEARRVEVVGCGRGGSRGEGCSRED